MEIYKDGKLIRVIKERPIYHIIYADALKIISADKLKDLEEHADDVLVRYDTPWRLAGFQDWPLSSMTKKVIMHGYYECYIEDGSNWHFEKRMYAVSTPFTRILYGGKIKLDSHITYCEEPKPLVYLKEYNKMIFARDCDPEDVRIPFPDLSEQINNERYKCVLPE